MTYYVPTSGELPAEILSRALFALARPLALQPPDSIQDAFTVIQALNGSYWLVVPDEFTLVMHPEAEIDGIATVLQPWENNGSLPPGTISDIDSWIQATRVLPSIQERTFCPWSCFPSFFTSRAKTHQQMLDQNLLPPLPLAP